MTIDGLGYFDKKKAGEALIERCKKLNSVDPVVIGDYKGFQMSVSIDTVSKTIYLELKNELTYKIELGSDIFGNIQRIDNRIDDISGYLEYTLDKFLHIFIKTHFEWSILIRFNLTERH